MTTSYPESQRARLTHFISGCFLRRAKYKQKKKEAFAAARQDVGPFFFYLLFIAPQGKNTRLLSLNARLHPTNRHIAPEGK
jgi:hypothetical protein